MTNFKTDTYTGATPLAAMRSGELINTMDALIGRTAGTIGEKSTLAILIGAIILVALIAALIYYSSVTVRTIFQAVPGVALAMLIIFGARYGLIWLYYRLGAFKYSSAEYHNILSKSKK